MGQSDVMRADPALLQIYYKDAGGNFIAVDEDHPLPTSGGGTSGDVTIAPGDVQIGAVEIKDVTGENRAAVDGTGHLAVADAAVLAALATLHGDTDGLEALLTTQAGYLDGLETAIANLQVAVIDSRDPDGAATTYTDVVVDATAGGVVVLAANAARKGFVVQNTSANNIRVSINNNPAVDKGIQLKAGESLSMSAPFCPVGVIKAIREGATSGACAAIEVV